MIDILRIKNILTRPRHEWAVIASEATTPRQLYMTYVMPLAMIGPLCGFVGASLIGVHAFDAMIRVPVTTALAQAVTGFALTLLGVFVLGRIIALLAPKFEGESNTLQALKVAAYAGTPAWLAGALRLIPSLSILGVLAALYSLYLLYTGLPIVMKSPSSRAMSYTAVVVLAAVALFICLGLVVSVFTPSPELQGFSMSR